MGGRKPRGRTACILGYSGIILALQMHCSCTCPCPFSQIPTRAGLTVPPGCNLPSTCCYVVSALVWLALPATHHIWLGWNPACIPSTWLCLQAPRMRQAVLAAGMNHACVQGILCQHSWEGRVTLPRGRSWVLLLQPLTWTDAVQAPQWLTYSQWGRHLLIGSSSESNMHVFERR